MQEGTVVAVCCKAEPNVLKPVVAEVYIRENWGVVGDYHAGEQVRHRYLAKKDPTAPNMRQVHLIQAELFDELAELGIHAGPGMMGENVTTRGIPLLSLQGGTRLHLGESIVLEVTELRTPCSQLNAVDPRLKDTVGYRLPDGTMVKKAGVMTRVITGGWLRPGDRITVEPAEHPVPLS